MWGRLLVILLGVLGEFLRLVLQRIGERDIINRIAQRASYHVAALEKLDLTDEEKRAQALALIKADADQLGKTLKDSTVNMILELALQALKVELGQL